MTPEARQAINAYSREWYWKNREHRLAYMKEWRAKNRDRTREYNERAKEKMSQAKPRLVVNCNTEVEIVAVDNVHLTRSTYDYIEAKRFIETPAGIYEGTFSQSLEYIVNAYRLEHKHDEIGIKE